ncbi:MAG: hypothetical protein GXP25_20185 [Planctomycetes bacterium]|nr:hypothetical protein [Planctomycetota bacterium]
MKKQKQRASPQKRSPVPPPERIIGDTSYQRKDDKQRLRNAVAEFQRDHRPSPIRLIILVLDGALWTVHTGSCSLLTPPLRKLDDATVADASDNTVTLARHALHILAWLRSQHILVSVANRSNPDNARELVKLFGLCEWVDSFSITRERKRVLVTAIRREIDAKYNIRLAPAEILLVDDAESGILDVQPPGIRTALIGREIKEIADLPAFLSKIQ